MFVWPAERVSDRLDDVKRRTSKIPDLELDVFVLENAMNKPEEGKRDGCVLLQFLR